jgi:hypothetical protein
MNFVPGFGLDSQKSHFWEIYENALQNVKLEVSKFFFWNPELTD